MCPLGVFLPAHDLFRKTGAHPRIKSEGMLFGIMRVRQIPPQYQCGSGALGLWIIIGAARYFVKAGTVVKPDRRIIVFVDFQKYSTRAKAGKSAQMQTK